MKNTFWVVRRKSDGLLSGGGNMARWNAKWAEHGKTWATYGRLRQHLKNNAKYYAAMGEDVEVVEVEITDVDVIPMGEALDVVKKRTEAYRKKEHFRSVKARLDYLRKEKARLEREIAKETTRAP